MNCSTGQLVNPEVFSAFTPEEKSKYVEVKRGLTAREKFDMQIKMYSPCGCGSGKKFKFCCHTH